MIASFGGVFFCSLSFFLNEGVFTDWIRICRLPKADARGGVPDLPAVSVRLATRLRAYITSVPATLPRCSCTFHHGLA